MRLPSFSLWFELVYIALIELKIYDPSVLHQSGPETIRGAVLMFRCGSITQRTSEAIRIS